MAKNIFIIYYSWSGNTGNIAKLIQQKTGGDLFEIKTVEPYPQNYNACVEQAKKEVHSGFMPELEVIPENPDDYDTVFIGTPVWWHTMVPPVLTLLSNIELSGKTVIPFCTHGGGGEAHSMTDIAKLCPRSTALPGLSLYESGGRDTETTIFDWLRRIGVDV